MFEPEYTPQQVRRLIRELLSEGKIRYTQHALEEMEKDDIEPKDVESALRGVCEEGEWENHQWRYRLHSRDIWAVVAFRDGELVIIITAWRKEPL